MNLSGVKSDIFVIAGKAKEALKEARLYQKAKELEVRLNQCSNYTEAMKLILEYVILEFKEKKK